MRAVYLSDLANVLWRDWASAPLSISYMFHTFSFSYSVLSNFIGPSFKIQFIPISLIRSSGSTGICISLPAYRGPSSLPHSFGDHLSTALCYCLKHYLSPILSFNCSWFTFCFTSETGSSMREEYVPNVLVSAAARWMVPIT